MSSMEGKYIEELQARVRELEDRLSEAERERDWALEAVRVAAHELAEVSAPLRTPAEHAVLRAIVRWHAWATRKDTSQCGPALLQNVRDAVDGLLAAESGSGEVT